MKKVFILINMFLIVAFTFSKEIKIKVIDKDLDIALEGVKIIVRNTEEIIFTNPEGIAIINVDDNEKRVILITTLIGYESKKVNIKELDKEIIITMSIEGMLEGEELVIEEDAIGRTDEEVGVSTVVDKNELKSTAMIGAVEDVMSTIKILPGVTYVGKYNTNLSIRGGDPDGLTTVLDGFIVRYPYHWGGGFSIFNPNTVESVKFSAGIFSVKHGLAMSGLMEVNSIKPDDGLKVDTLISTSTIEAFLQTPIGLKNAGLYIGGRITFYDFVFLMTGSIMEEQGVTFSRKPYIYDAYLKWFYKPHKRVELYVNGFFGSDGIGMETYEPDKSPEKEIVNTFNFNWYNYDVFVNTGIKILPIDRIFIHVLAGYEFLLTRATGILGSHGTKKYSKEFIDLGTPFYDATRDGDDFSIDANSTFGGMDYMHSIQARVDTDITLHDQVILSFGTGMIFDFYIFAQTGKFWSITYENNLPTFKRIDFTLDASDNRILKSFGYLNFNFKIIPEIFKIEIGCRADHNVIYGPDNFSVNTYPIPGPRLNIIYTPVKGLKYLESLSLSAGLGLFSKVPQESVAANEEYGIKDFEYTIPKSLTTVLGFELKFPLGFKFKIEGYYKYIFDRFYINGVTTSGEIDFKIHSDGIGHAAGFDILFERNISRYIDGIITYSFIYARMYNPITDKVEDEVTVSGEPTGIWFYPSYHRFHTLNIVLNIKPVPWMTITPKLSFATGTPKKEFGDKEMFAAQLEDGTSAEMYTRKQTYSDELRTDFSIPFDLKIAFNFYYPKTKIRMETYIAVEDLFVVVYNPSTGIQTDQFTGEDEPSPESRAEGFPIVSFGMKLSY